MASVLTAATASRRPPAPPPPPPPPPPAAAPASAPAAAPAAAPKAPPASDAAKLLTNPDVKAARQGTSDFTQAKGKAPVDLSGGGSPPNFNLSISKTDEVAKAGAGPLTATITNTATVSASHTQAVKAGEGGPKVSNVDSVSESDTVTAKVKADGGKFDAGASVGVGESIKTEVTTPVGSKGDVNPLEPEKMPVGSKVMVTAGASANQGSDANAKLFSAGVPVPKALEKVLPKDLKVEGSVGLKEDQSKTAALQASVEKVSDNKIRVSVGPQDAFKTTDAATATLKADKFSVTGSLVGEHSQSLTHLDTRDIDLSNPKGREAYQKFITGQAPFPDADPASGITAGFSDQYKVTDETRAEISAKLGTLAPKTAIPIANADGGVKFTRNPDGSSSVSLSKTNNDESITVTQAFGADGKEDLSKRKYDFVWQNASPDVAQSLAMGASNNPTFASAIQHRTAGGQHVQFTFTQADMDKLVAQAKASPQAADPTNWAGRVARAQNVGDLMRAFTDPRHAGGVDDIGTLASRTGSAVPGKAFFLDPKTNQTWRFDQPVIRPRSGVPLWTVQ